MTLAGVGRLADNIHFVISAGTQDEQSCLISRREQMVHALVKFIRLSKGCSFSIPLQGVHY
jgi:hypothetical protein